MFDFGIALDLLRTGQAVTRKGWNGNLDALNPRMWLLLQRPDKKSKMTLPYIYLKTTDEHLVPWLASQTDVLAQDWTIVQGVLASGQATPASAHVSE